jgi:dolichol kinase
MDNSISYKSEILRKGIHLCSLSIPIAYIFTDRILALQIILPLTSIMVIADILSKREGVFNKLIFGFLGALMRKHEKESKGFVLNGASWVLISASLCIFIFPKVITVISFTILIISDLLAALIGRKFGRMPLFDKSWEGTFAFIGSAFIVVGIYFYVFSAPLTLLYMGFIASVFGGFVEAGSKMMNIDDNISIPISIGIILWLGGFYAQIINFPYLNLI